MQIAVLNSLGHNSVHYQLSYGAWRSILLTFLTPFTYPKDPLALIKKETKIILKMADEIDPGLINRCGWLIKFWKRTQISHVVAPVAGGITCKWVVTTFIADMK